MNCEQFHDFVHAYLDGELDLMTSIEIEKHILACRECSETYQKQRALNALLSNAAMRFQPAQSAKMRVLEAIRASEEPEKQQRRWRFLSWNVFTAGTLATAALFVLLLVLTNHVPSRSTHRLVHELTSSHIRSLMAMHIIDVASSDQHTVKPWFNGKLDFSPPVRDLASEGFPLTGGRLDFIGDRPVAATVYTHRKHIINLFMWPLDNSSEAATSIRDQNGYNLVHWVDGGTSFWAVSDLNEGELQQFAKDYQSSNR
jgi:anti-sigma factor RsiW